MKTQNFNPNRRQLDGLLSAFNSKLSLMQYVPDNANNKYIYLAGVNGLGITYISMYGYLYTTGVIRILESIENNCNKVEYLN